MSRRKADELAQQDETPLDVMIDNMLFWRAKAHELTAEMQKKIELISKLDISDSNERKEFITMMGEFNKLAAHMIAARENSQKCAVEAAPYVHPRFASISVKQQSTNVKIQMSLTTAIANVLTDNQPKQLNGHDEDDGQPAESAAA